MNKNKNLVRREREARWKSVRQGTKARPCSLILQIQWKQTDAGSNSCRKVPPVVSRCSHSTRNLHSNSGFRFTHLQHRHASQCSQRCLSWTFACHLRWNGWNKPFAETWTDPSLSPTACGSCSVSQGKKTVPSLSLSLYYVFCQRCWSFATKNQTNNKKKSLWLSDIIRTCSQEGLSYLKKNQKSDVLESFAPRDQAAVIQNISGFLITLSFVDDEICWK